MKAMAGALQGAAGDNVTSIVAGDARLVLFVRTSEDGLRRNVSLVRDFDSTDEQFAGALEAVTQFSQTLLDAIEAATKGDDA